MIHNRFCIAVALLLLSQASSGATASAASLSIAQVAPSKSVFITLGTMAGGIPSAKRSQPANLILSHDHTILIDAGDGAAEQLAKVGVPLTQIHTIFLTHLHYDHVGGLFAILGLRYQINSPGVVTIYGPPGTKQMVDGLLAAMQPESESANGVPGQTYASPLHSVSIVEISGGQSVTLDDITVKSTVNTHYSFPAGSPEAARYQSLSYRFDLPDRSIMVTGDTGPSINVERLAHGADLLVSEIIDPDAALATVVRLIPNLPPAAMATLRQHMNEQHLTAEQVGSLAHSAGVKELVLTHNGLGDDGGAKATATIASQFKGKISIANDLDRF
jgi:ribonuclease BN (tRNA processing enzyme)